MSIAIDRKGKWRLLWGNGPLPREAEVLGTVARNDSDRGALIRLATGVYVQGNAGAIRTLPQTAIKGALGLGADSWLQIRVTDADKRTIEAHAAEEGLSVSEYVRDRALRRR